MPTPITRFREIPFPHSDLSINHQTHKILHTFLETLSLYIMGLPEGALLNHKWKVKSFLAEGGFGAVYHVKSSLTGRRAVAKICHRNCDKNTIKREATIYSSLNVRYPRQFAKMLDAGHCNGLPFIVLELLGSSLADDLMDQHLRNYHIRDVAQIGVRVLNSIKHLHDAGYIHRDIKPDNILLGTGILNRGKPYLVDFGISALYKDSRGSHIHEGRGSKCGTRPFASVRGTEGYKQCRADDLESFMYMLVYISKGGLPWQEIGNDNSISSYKRSMRHSRIFMGLPIEMVKIMSSILSTPFNKRPDYEYIRAKLKAMAK